KRHPEAMIRNSAAYLKDVFEYFGSDHTDERNDRVTRWRLFDTGTERHVQIIGTERVQDEIYKGLVSFARQGFSNKLILLHGPNGSAKSSIIESIGYAM